MKLDKNEATGEKVSCEVLMPCKINNVNSIAPCNLLARIHSTKYIFYIESSRKFSKFKN